MFTTLDLDFLLKLTVNTMSISFLVLGCYLRGFFKEKGGNSEHATSFILFAVGVFSVTYLLHTIDISMGFAFGLFAIFSMLRYRTESISVKEMTYLFMVIAISLLSAVGDSSIFELIILHCVFLFSAILCETILLKKSISQKVVEYELIENILPSRRDVLMSDLKERTGLKIIGVHIEHIDFIKDSATIIVRYQNNIETKKITEKSQKTSSQLLQEG